MSCDDSVDFEWSNWPLDSKDEEAQCRVFKQVGDNPFVTLVWTGNASRSEAFTALNSFVRHLHTLESRLSKCKIDQFRILRKFDGNLRSSKFESPKDFHENTALVFDRSKNLPCLLRFDFFSENRVLAGILFSEADTKKSSFEGEFSILISWPLLFDETILSIFHELQKERNRVVSESGIDTMISYLNETLLTLHLDCR